jgi:hypothetical protein
MLFTDLWAALSTVCQEVDKHQEDIQQLLQMQKGVYHLVTLFRMTVVINPLHGADLFFRNHQLCICSRTSQRLKEPEDSLQCSQKPYTGFCPERDQSSPDHTILSL